MDSRCGWILLGWFFLAMLDTVRTVPLARLPDNLGLPLRALIKMDFI
jgi:hypothetical protein